MKNKHTNLRDEIFTMKKPNTSWHSTLAAVAGLIAFCFVVYVVMTIISV